MMALSPAAQFAKIKRGTVDCLTEAELLAKLESGRSLRIKAGFDPTAPDLHLGHLVLLNKLKQFQEFGHQVIFLIGDFTAQIGDPSGRNELRPALSETEIRRNVLTYQEQVFRILDPKKTQVAYNSAWMGRASANDLLKLAMKQTVAQTLVRDDFEKRYRSGDPIYLHEFLYPLIQGYDSVELRADVEVGGTDQKFNLLVGRELQRASGLDPQVVLTLPLLVGTDGVKKMSKSFGNTIGFTEPPHEIFGKVMSLSDESMWCTYELVTDWPSEEEMQALKKIHPMEAKKRLATEIVKRLTSLKVAREAAEEFDKVFSRRELPSSVDQVTLRGRTEKVPLVVLLPLVGLTPSRSEAKRLILQSAVTVNNRRIDDPGTSLDPSGEYVIQVGKRRFKKVLFAS